MALPAFETSSFTSCCSRVKATFHLTFRCTSRLLNNRLRTYAHELSQVTGAVLLANFLFGYYVDSSAVDHY